MPRRAHRLDANHEAIVNALCAEPNVSVCSLAGVAAGCPDLLVGFRGVTHLVEVKDGAKPPSRRTLTPDQRRWIDRWHGGTVWILTGDADPARSQGRGERPDEHADQRAPWSSSELVPCADGRARRIPQSGIFPLAHGIPSRVGQLRAYGNAIVPHVAAVFIRAYRESVTTWR